MERTAGVEIAVNADSAAARVIYLGVPTFGRVSIRWHAHMMQLQNPMNRSVFHGYAMGFEVGQARNYLVTQALEWTNTIGHTISHLFFVDDDVLVPPYALTALLARNRPIVSGLYFAKCRTPQPLVLNDEFGGIRTDLPRNEVIDCTAHGMGCTLIELRVFRELLAAGTLEMCKTKDGKELPQWFATTRDKFSADRGHHVLYNETEDVHFLRGAKQIGYQPSVDTGVFCFHWDEGQQVGYPLHLWEEFEKTGNVTIGQDHARSVATVA
jgi:hypothetical protein